MDCNCIGSLKQKDGKVYLFTEEVSSTRSIYTKKQDFKKATMKTVIRDKITLAKHGFATDIQKRTYLTLGSIFWLTIMLIGRVSLEIFNLLSLGFSGLRVFIKISRCDNFFDDDMSSELQKMRDS